MTFVIIVTKSFTIDRPAPFGGGEVAAVACVEQRETSLSVPCATKVVLRNAREAQNDCNCDRVVSSDMSS